MRLSSIVPVLFVLVASASPAFAQLCTGNAEISRRSPVNVGGTLGMGDGWKTVAAAVAAGADRFYARASVDSTGFENFDNRSLGISGSIAGQFQSGRLHACPFVGAGRTNGPDGDNYSSSSNSVSGGVALGFVARETARDRIVPSVNLNMNRSSTTFDFGEEFELGKASSTGTQAAFGVGYVRKHFSVQPSISLFINDGNVTPAYYVEVYWAPGKR